MIASPCTAICRIEPETGWCLGCGRTLAEIAAWPAADEAMQKTILARLPPRLDRLARFAADAPDR